MSHTIDKRATYTLLRLHERNYLLLKQLVPDLRSMDAPAESHGRDGRALHLNILEQAKYTTTISLTQFLDAGELRLPYPDLQIRVYHDAEVAEILRYRRRTGLSWLDPLIRFQDLERADKERINRFLTRWLGECIAQGHLLTNAMSKKSRDEDVDSLTVS